MAAPIVSTALLYKLTDHLSMDELKALLHLVRPADPRWYPATRTQILDCMPALARSGLIYLDATARIVVTRRGEWFAEKLLLAPAL